MFGKDSIRIAVSFAPFPPVREASPAVRRTPCGPEADVPGDGGRRAGKPDRIAVRPDPEAWAQDELLTLREAAALAGTDGPTERTLRTAIAMGRLAHARIAGRIYTTRAALAAMVAREGGRPGTSGTAKADWDAHVASLLDRSGGRGG